MTVAPSSMAAPHVGLFVVRVLSPVFVFLATLSLVFTRPTPATLSTSPITSVVVATRVPRRSLILFLLSVTALTYFLDGATFVLSAVVYKYWPRHTGIDFNAVLGVVAFFGLAALGTWKEIHGIQVWTLKRISSGLAASLLLDIAQILLVGLSIRASGRFPPIGVPEDQRGLPIAPLLHFAFPCIRVLVLLPLLVALLSPRVVYIPAQGGEAVDAPQPVASTLLLPSPGTQVQASTGLSPLSASTAENTKYGTFRSSRTTTSHTSDSTSRTTTPVPANAEKPAITPDPTWGEMWRRFRRISPYLWPSKSPRLQFLAALCIILLLISRAVNAFMPFTLGAVVSILEQGSSRSLWPYVGLYVGLRFLQSPGGINALRNSLWFPVMQYSDREMSLLSFDHILNLSFSFHTHRKTGEILRILDRGAVINHTLEIIMFSVVPTLIDITVALVIFAFTFGWLLSLIIFCVMALYVWASIYLTSWRTQIRRKMNDHDVVTRGIHADCLLNYETIKYFGGEQHESQRYQDAIHEYQKFEYQVELSLSLLNVVQNFIISTGLLLSSMVVALRVTNGKGTASEFVIFITYLNQLYGPLASLGWTYRSINQSLVDTEKLLNLLNEPSEVNDKPNAPDLVVDHGEIEFRNVSFSYDGRNKALNGISFKVPKGSSVALVGESGAGKSTILRLLYRFYDLKVGDGHILIDGRDITEVTQSSLRKAIGVVPQDPVLFNASISYNVGYGKFGSSPEEIEQAAKAAQMHERITTFPDGYETKVGERGIRLSGGEKQRVAIARTLLKNPPILLLDEATSALDTSTEKDIQKALQNLIKGRSSLSIAHRLSTIASADVILVLKDGEIIEQGSHRELIAQGGVFASMWADQISASDELAISIGEGSSTKEASGYVVDQARADPPVQTEAEAETAPGILEGGLVATPEMALEELPPQDTGVDATGPGANVARVSPSAEVQPEGSTPAESPATPTQAPGVSFPRELSTPERSGTPDPESETKRKILSSQNFQRLARKMSLTTRRPGSTSSIPIISGFLRDSSPRGSVEGEGEVGASESPSSSLPGDSDKTRTKRDKKERKRKSIL